MQNLRKNVIRLTIFLIPFYFLRFSIFGLKTNIFEIGVLLSLAAALSAHRSLRLRLGSVWPYLFLFLALVGVFISQDRTSALGIFKGWFLVPAVLYLIVINTCKTSEIGDLVRPLFWSANLVSVWAILQYLRVIGLLFYQKSDPASFLPYLDQHRAFGPFESPNYLAMFLVPVLFLLILVFKREQWLAGVTAFLGLIALVMSKSNGGYMALLLPACWYGFSLLNSNTAVNNWIKIAGSIILRAAPVVVVLLAYEKLISDPLRLDIWRYSWQMTKANWFFGLGLGDFQDKIAKVAGNDASFMASGLPYALHPHNVFLAMWANLGLLGLVCFVIMLFLFYTRLVKNRGHVSMVLGMAMLAILVQGLVDTTYFKNDLSAIFWLLIALSIVYSSKKQSDETKS